MTSSKHSYEDIIRLDSERTPGIWEAGVHPGNHRLNIVKPICFGKYVGKLPECEGGAVYFLHTANAQYIAAMPDAVGLLRRYRERLIENQWVFKALVEDYKKAGNEISAGLMQERIKQIDELLQEQS